ncbi:MAG: 4Fe-4S binding protein, partial [Candidatus Hodarchaeota archaeon]
MSTFEIKVDHGKCTGCSLCVNTCPINLEIEPQLKYGESPKTDKVIFKLINGKCRV